MSIDYTKKYVNTYYYKNGKINKINSTNNPIFGLSVSVYCDDKMVITYYKMQHVYLIYSDMLIDELPYNVNDIIELVKIK